MRWLALTLAVAAAPAWSGETLKFGRFGDVTVTRPRGAPTSMALFFSGDGGWNVGTQEMADTLAKEGALVLGLDVRRYTKSFVDSKSCAYPAGDLEVLAQGVQKKLGFPEYLRPVVVGYSSGATIAYMALAQAPVGTFRGAISLGFCPDVSFPAPMCARAALKRQRSKDGKSEVALAPPEPLPGEWAVLHGDVDQTCALDQAKAFVTSVKAAKLVDLTDVGHGFSKPGHWRAQLLAAYKEIATPAPPPQVAEPQPPLPPDVPQVKDLPLFETHPTSATERPVLGLLISGDGGWAGIDQSLAAALNAEGIPVIGLDSLRYFWTRRTPQETTDAVARALRHYMAKWNKTDIVLVGYSRGADLLPFVAHLLPEDLKARTRLVALVAGGKQAEFEIHVTDIFGGSGGKTSPTLPELEAIKGQALLCVYGDEETSDSVCPSIRAFPGVRVLELSGGHHFGGNYDAVAKAVVEALPQ